MCLGPKKTLPLRLLLGHRLPETLQALLGGYRRVDFYLEVLAPVGPYLTERGHARFR